MRLPALLLLMGLLAPGVSCRARDRTPPSGDGAPAPASVQTAPSMSPSPKAPDDLASLASELRQLRKIPGHFSTPPAPWNPEVDAPDGRKRQVMVALERRLGAGSRPKQEIIDLLGAPDAVAHPGDELYTLVLGEKPADAPDELLIYFWRGTHDFLFFPCTGTTASGPSWWYAGE